MSKCQPSDKCRDCEDAVLLWEYDFEIPLLIRCKKEDDLPDEEKPLGNPWLGDFPQLTLYFSRLGLVDIDPI